MSKPKLTFLAFFLIWAERMRWEVPDVHVRAAHWIEHFGDVGVLRCFRGFGKSTLLAVYNAWRYYQNPQYRILHQSESDPTAYKTSRDTQNVLKNHPLTRGMFRDGGVQEWWVEGAVDPRNASMYARGILSNVTSARADECQNDDVEVPRNITTPDAREKLRYRLGEQTHILVPGGRSLYIGTPHTHDSLYDELDKSGADCLTIKMFEHEQRVESAIKGAQVMCSFAPEFVFAGIGKHAKLLQPGKDYQLSSDGLTIKADATGLVDLYGRSAWPERFDRNELLKRRKKTRTINEWDSQYQLHSRPVTETRLDPEKMIPYADEPLLRSANGGAYLLLGDVRIVGVRARWDCSLGKIKSDSSAVGIIFTDAEGRLFWHRSVALTGDLEEFDRTGLRLVGGQIKQLIDLLVPLHVPNIVIETNGPGGFLPAIARKHLAKHGISVTEDHAKTDKNKDILDAFEAPLSSGFLFAHMSVFDSSAYDEMLQFNPAIKNQPDDHLDSAARAIKATPVRIGGKVRIVTNEINNDWRPDAGSHDIELTY